MQNPQMSKAHPSVMGGLGILQPTAPPPALLGRSPGWLRERVAEGEYRRVDLVLDENRSPTAEQQAGAAFADMADRRPIAFFLIGPESAAPMHWHGTAGAWLHECFFRHRLARAKRQFGDATAAEPAPAMAASEQHTRSDLLAVPAGPMELDKLLFPDRYLIGIHVREFPSAEWNLPGSYYVSAVRAVFDATPLSCGNTQVLH